MVSFCPFILSVDDLQWKRGTAIFLFDDFLQTEVSFSQHTLYGEDQRRYVHTVGSKNFYLQYDIKVQAFNVAGRGPESPIVTIMSAEDSECIESESWHHFAVCPPEN